MSNFITKALASIFGSKNDRDTKELQPYVGLINEIWEQVRHEPDQALRERSASIKTRIAEGLVEIDGQINGLRAQAAAEGTPLGEKDRLFDQIDALEKERNKHLEAVLLTVLPEAFAVMKDTARRLTENKRLVVPATAWDEEYLQDHPHVTIQDGQAIWPNVWMAAGTEIIWEMVHYDVQLIGGVVLHQGKIAEMATGEGKTLVATLPSFLNALAGRGVHIVTVNDYLAKRDSEWMGPLMAFHGLRVDCIDKHEPNSEERRAAYNADITYGTNNEFGFDYLRDNMAREVDELVQRKLHYAMVDEVDSVLIDDARTPLIISGPMAQGDRQDFEALKPRISRVVEQQKALTNKLLNEARKLIADGNEKDGGLALFRAYRGLPKAKPLIKFLSEPGMRAILQKTENNYLQDNARQMPEADKPLYFVIDEKQNNVDLTENGLEYITQANEDPQFFILPDISTGLSAIEGNKKLAEEERLSQKDQLLDEYAAKSQRIHTVQQLLKAYCTFEKEVEYIIVDGKIKIVDEQTGRIMEGRRYSDGLHQAIEAKEGVRVEDATQTYATVTLQNYFRMYHKLCGMTGTAETEAGEFWSIYKLDVVQIPTNRSAVRKDHQDKVYKTVREKYNAVVDEINALVELGRPVLVGTTSVENSELLSRLLKVRKINHQVLNAKYHQREAEIVAEAGKPGTVTIATNMAGRGTDIKLTPESRASGGLAIIGTERHESRRVDRQLRGRSGRQGDPGSSQFFVSLEDGLMRLFGSERISSLMDKMGMQEGEVIQHSMITSSIERAQKKVEENNFGTRKRLLEYDDVMNSQREVIYRRRRNALYGERLELDIQNVIYQAIGDAAVSNPGGENAERFHLRLFHLFGFNPGLTSEESARLKPNEVAGKVYPEVAARYRARQEDLASTSVNVLTTIRAQHGPQVDVVGIPFNSPKVGMQIPLQVDETLAQSGRNTRLSLERASTLAMIDQAWKEHLREMDELRQSVQNAHLEQKDPLLIYKFEAVKLFKGFLADVNEQIVTFLFRAEVPPIQEGPALPPQRQQAPRQIPQPQGASAGREVHNEMDSILNALRAQAAGPQQEAMVAEEALEGADPNPRPRPQPIRTAQAPNRNDKVTVRYMATGQIKQTKYKAVEEDIRRGLCMVVDMA